VTLSTATSGASINYTTDGSAPSDTAGTLYSGPITVSNNTTIKAVAFASGLTDSTVTTANYRIRAVAPAFSPAGGKYTSPQTVTLSTATAGPSINYTTDGSAPSATKGTPYTGPITVSTLTTIKAVAYGGGFTTSTVSRAKYMFTAPAPVLTLVPNLLNMVVGDTAVIQALNAASQPVMGLVWTTSDPTVVSLSGGDPPLLTAVAPGQVTIKAGGASASVTVSATALPLGTVLWSNPGDGSGVSSIVPAVPSPNGVADVFAFQNDGTVQAITSDGTTAWTVDLDINVLQALPDFQGGLVSLTCSPVYDWACTVSKQTVIQYDGVTGQANNLYSPPASTGTGSQLSTYWLEDLLAVHTDGTIFVVLFNEQWDAGNSPSDETDTLSWSVIGIDSATGAQTVNVKIPGLSLDSASGQIGSPWGIMVAGDGYAYVPYNVCQGAAEGEPPASSMSCHFGLFRVNSSGESDDNEIQAYSENLTTSPEVVAGPGGRRLARTSPGVSRANGMRAKSSQAKPRALNLQSTANESLFEPGINMISNADQGIVLAWVTDQPYLAITTGVSVSVMITPNSFLPVLQAQDGSFYGGVGEIDSLDQSGNLRWSVPNDSPYIATADGGVIGTSGIMYDQNGNPTGQIANGIPDWNGQIFAAGSSTVNMEYAWVGFAPGFASEAGGSPSGNGTSALMLGTAEGVPIWPKLKMAPACVLGADTDKPTLGGTMRGQYDTAKQALLAYLGTLTTTSPCGKFFAGLDGGASYFNQLSAAVTRQTPFDGLLSHLSRFDAGLIDAETQLEHPDQAAKAREYPVCDEYIDYKWNKWNTVAAVAQVYKNPGPPTDVYVVTLEQALKYMTPDTVLHEALHNLTGLDDNDLYTWLTGKPLPAGPTTPINRTLINCGCVGANSWLKPLAKNTTCP